MNAPVNSQPQLKGVSSIHLKKRVKMLLFGQAKTGKSLFCTQFPNSYYIDTEHGIEFEKYASNIQKNNSSVFQTRDYKELYEQVKLLFHTSHSYQTLVIDSISTIRDSLVDEELEKIEGSGKQSKYSQEHQFANLKLKRLYNLLLDMDLHVIITAHSKEKYGADEFKVIGTTADAHKKKRSPFRYYFRNFC